jgi:hypothetical protein
MRSRRTHAFGILPTLTLVAERIIYKPKSFVKGIVKYFFGEDWFLYVGIDLGGDYD